MPSRAALRAVLIAGPLLIVAAVVLVLSVGDRPLLGTNRVAPASFFAVVPPGGQACTGDAQVIPAGTGRLVVRTSTDESGSLGVSLVQGARTIASGRLAGPYDAGDTAVPLSAPVRRSLRALVCVRNGGSKPLGLSGSPAGMSPGAVRVNGTPVDALFRIEYRAADRESWWSRIGDIAGRFADGKASFVGSWTMWVALGFTLLAIGVGLFGLAGMPRRRAALLCALVAVLNALAWGLLVPPFQVPDEESHTAYVQYLAETGKVPKPGVVGYSPEESGLLSALDFVGTVGVRDNHPPSGPALRARLRALERSNPGRVGTGDPAGAVIYPPTFYALETIPYELSPTGSSLLDRLVWMRVLCALLAGGTVFLAFRFLREVLPDTPWTWTVGGLALAFFPMFGFVSGGVQNDALMYLCAAGLFWAMARVLRHGLTPLRGLALGGALAAGVLVKFTMVGLAPAAVATVLVALWRARRDDRPASSRDAVGSGADGSDRPAPSPDAVGAESRSGQRRARAGAIVAAVTAAVPVGIYAALSTWVWDRPLNGPLRASHEAVAHPAAATIGGQLSYAWQLYLPRLPFMDDKFRGVFPPWDTWYRGGIGRFGWLDYGFPEWVAIALLPVVLAIVVLAVKTLLVSRPRVADVGVFATAVLGLLALLAIVGYHYELKYETYFHSARYLFVLLPLGALAVAAAARGAGRRFGPAFGAFVVVIAMALTVFGQLATLERYYS